MGGRRSVDAREGVDARGDVDGRGGVDARGSGRPRADDCLQNRCVLRQPKMPVGYTPIKKIPIQTGRWQNQFQNISWKVTFCCLFRGREH